MAADAKASNPKRQRPVPVSGDHFIKKQKGEIKVACSDPAQRISKRIKSSVERTLSRVMTTIRNASWTALWPPGTALQFFIFAALVVAFVLRTFLSKANPEDGQVVAGGATINRTTPSRLDVIQKTNKAIIDWRSFSIDSGRANKFPATLRVRSNSEPGRGWRYVQYQRSAHGERPAIFDQPQRRCLRQRCACQRRRSRGDHSRHSKRRFLGGPLSF